MRCKACDAKLTDNETTYKDSHGYIDLCSMCIKLSNEAINDDTEEIVRDYIGIGRGNNIRSSDDMDG